MEAFGDLLQVGWLDQPLPLLVQPRRPAPLQEYGAECRALASTHLERAGALLFRGFAIDGQRDFEVFTRFYSIDFLHYVNASTPRTRLQGAIYTSTEYPADQTISLHNEMSYTREWPRLLWFYCQIPAATGGATPIADSRAIYRTMPHEIRADFERSGIRYVRNYHESIDVPWQKVFGTDQPQHVARLCETMGLAHEWRGKSLRTWQTCQASMAHPGSGEMVWFNQAHLFHVSSLPARLEQGLRTVYKEADLPRNAFFGDHRPIPLEQLTQVRQVLEAQKVRFDWHAGDILMLDNMAVAHGREPFSGKRSILVAMADRYVHPDAAPGSNAPQSQPAS